MLERTFRADEKVPLAVIDKREMQYLYREGERATSSWTTSPTTRCTSTTSKLGEHRRLPQGGRLRRPAHVQRRRRRASSSPPRSSSPSAETEPGVQGDRVSGARKPATLETGLVVQVPLVRRAGRADQGRHPHRGIPGARLTADGRHGKPPRSPGAGPGPLLRARGARPRRRHADRASSRRRPTSTPSGSCVGVEEHHADVDALLRKFSEHWALERMPAVDRAVLRLGRLRARLASPRCRPRS